MKTQSNMLLLLILGALPFLSNCGLFENEQVIDTNGTIFGT